MRHDQGGEGDGFRAAERQFAADLGMTFERRTVRLPTPVDGVDAAGVIESGTGSPALFVHGGGGMACHWLPLLARLDGRRAIAVDRPGCGLTGPVDYRRIDVRAHAVAFLEGTMDALGLPEVDVVANSMGALWSLWFALEHPERVRSLSLLGCPALVVGTSAPVPMRVVSRRGLGRAMEQPATDTSMRKVMGMMGHPQTLFDDLPASFLDVSVRGGNLPGAAHTFRTLVWRVTRLRGARPAVRLDADELRGLGVDPLVVWGTSDPFGDVDAARRLCAATNGRLEVLGVGHLPWLDDPIGAARLVRAHLEAPVSAS